MFSTLTLPDLVRDMTQHSPLSEVVRRGTRCQPPETSSNHSRALHANRPASCVTGETIIPAPQLAARAAEPPARSRRKFGQLASPLCSAHRSSSARCRACRPDSGNPACTKKPCPRALSERQRALQGLQVGVGDRGEQVGAVAAGQRRAQVAPHGRRAGVEPQRARVVARRRVIVPQARLPPGRTIFMVRLGAGQGLQRSHGQHLAGDQAVARPGAVPPASARTAARRRRGSPGPRAPQGGARRHARVGGKAGDRAIRTRAPCAGHDRS